MMRQRPPSRPAATSRPLSAPPPSSHAAPSSSSSAVRRRSPSAPRRSASASSSSKASPRPTPTDLDLSHRSLSAALHAARLDVSSLTATLSSVQSELLRLRASDDEAKSEARRLESKLLGEVGVVRRDVARALDDAAEEARAVKRAVEEGGMTAERRRELSMRVEAEVAMTVAKTIEGRLDRELENTRITIRGLGTEVERGGVMAMKAVQDVERRLFQQESKMFETEKECKTLSRIVRSSAGLAPLDEQQVGGDLDSRAPNEGFGMGYGAAGGGGLYHRLSVMDFAMKGLVERMNNMEREMQVKDEKIAKLMKDNLKLMETKGAELQSALHDSQSVAAKNLEAKAAQTHRALQQLMFDFESTVASDAAERNDAALKTARAALLAVQSAKAEQEERARRTEVAVGAIRIEVDRLGGDTARAVEALADGLVGVRGEIRRVEGAGETERIRMRDSTSKIGPTSQERQKYYYDNSAGPSLHNPPSSSLYRN